MNLIAILWTVVKSVVTVSVFEFVVTYEKINGQYDFLAQSGWGGY